MCSINSEDKKKHVFEQDILQTPFISFANVVYFRAMIYGVHIKPGLALISDPYHWSYEANSQSSLTESVGFGLLALQSHVALAILISVI